MSRLSLPRLATRRTGHGATGLLISFNALNTQPRHRFRFGIRGVRQALPAPVAPQPARAGRNDPSPSVKHSTLQSTECHRPEVVDRVPGMFSENLDMA